MKLEINCPVCNKKGVSEKSHFVLGKKRFITLDCGHTYSIDQISESKLDKITLADGRVLYPFQYDGVRFAEKSNFRCLISDEMGLGKTIQAVGALSLHLDDLKPVVVIVKSSLTYQWMKEIVTGTGNPLVQILDTKDNPLPGFPIYICSFDSLPPRKKKGTENEYTDGLGQKLKVIKPKTLIIDECQMLKNHSAARTNAIRELCRIEVDYVPPKNVPLKRARIEMIAKDLMKMHGVNKNFELIFANLDSKYLGLCECKAVDGIIKGKIYISRQHAENDSEEEIIETILHEIAHAITPGAGHKTIWKETAIQIGSSGAQFANCEGTKEPIQREYSVKHIIALSGTPIKNNAVEYFPILNLLHPEMFHNRDNFIDFEVDHYWDGRSYKAGGLKYPDEFLNKTKDFIIRRSRQEVLPDLPKIQRDYKFYPMSDVVMKAYNKKVNELADFMESEEYISKSAFSAGTDLLAQLQILRHITGLAKVEPVLDYVSEYLEEHNGDSKITIFHHHIDVGKVLVLKLNELFPDSVIQMTAQDDSETRGKKIEQFRSDPSKKILVAPTLACGEGINLQFCNHAILMEREWNPANEEQAEGRFSRIGAISSSVLVNYPTATGTIDEFFAEIVERKREIVGSTLDGKADKWDQSSIMMELAQTVVNRWRM